MNAVKAPVVKTSLAAERKTHIQRRLSTRVTRVILEPVTLEDMPEITAVARVAYNPKLLSLCLETLNFHAECLRYGLNDGRTLFQFKRSNELVGVCGLHRYLWGPPTVCWISWFFIAPPYRGRWTALSMFSALLDAAREREIRTLYLETPSDHPEYSSLKTYLDRIGFTHEASISDYYEKSVNLLIYKMDIKEG